MGSKHLNVSKGNIRIPPEKHSPTLAGKIFPGTMSPTVKVPLRRTWLGNTYIRNWTLMYVIQRRLTIKNTFKSLGINHTRTMRLPYAPSTPPVDAPPDTADIYARIAERRNPRPLIPLDLSLLHSPPVADGWNSFIGAIRSRTLVDSGVMELAVCRVAVLNNAVYEWNAHAPLALKGGISPINCRLLLHCPAPPREILLGLRVAPSPRNSAPFYAIPTR